MADPLRQFTNMFRSLKQDGLKSTMIRMFAGDLNTLLVVTRFVQRIARAFGFKETGFVNRGLQNLHDKIDAFRETVLDKAHEVRKGRSLSDHTADALVKAQDNEREKSPAAPKPQVSAKELDAARVAVGASKNSQTAPGDRSPDVPALSRMPNSSNVAVR